MPRNTSQNAKVQKAARFFVTGSGFNVPQAMRAANFSGPQSYDKTLQQLVRRVVAKQQQPAPPLPLPPSIIGSTMSIDGSISSLSTQSPAVKFARPKIKQIRKTTTGMQHHRANIAIDKKHASAAHKRATTILSEERKKPKWRSSQNVCDQIEGEYGVKLSRHTLNRYVKDGYIGSSPLRNGSPGTIPEFVFKTLCTAMESYIYIQPTQWAKC